MSTNQSENILLKTSAIQPCIFKSRFALTYVQFVALSLLLALGFMLIGATIDIALINTLLIFLFVTLGGLWLCHRTKVTAKDSRLRILGTFWIIKLLVTLTLLYAGWMPQLDPGSVSWGYDPQRYFQDSWHLIENDWNPVVGQNYQGIIFYYAAIFYLFGHNPVIPALINAFVTLLGTLFLIRCAYAFAPNRTSKDWHIAGLLLVPEVLWYDVMTSRETLMAVLILVAAIAAGRYMVGVNRASLMKTLVLSGAAFIAILAVRTSMAISLAASIVIMALLLKSRSKMRLVLKVLLVLLAIGALTVGPIIQQLTGGYDINYLTTFGRLQSFESNVASRMEWSDASIGLLLSPNNAWQAAAFMPPRMLLYLAAPLPNIAVSLTDLIGGSWSAWQSLMTIPTSAMMLLGFPYVLAGTAQAWSHRKKFPASLIIPITFWITFAAVAGGNIIIHERYRVMFTLLLFACMWFGYTRCSRCEVKRWALPWFSLIVAGAVFYMSYKFIG